MKISRFLGASSRKGCGLLLLLLLFTAGCSPQKYIFRADQEVQQIINCDRMDPRWSLPDYRFRPESDSRLYMNYCQEMPCRPLDDPASHQYMYCVDGKRGWKGWDRYGVEGSVDYGRWLQSMDFNEDGKVVIDRQKAIQLALKNSRDFQSARESLYLAALSVTYERFRFDIQPFAGIGSTTSTDFAYDHSETTRVTAQAKKLTATGAEIVVNAANTIVWTFGGGNSGRVSTSLLDFSIMQPLLQYAGRAYTLESLTTSERALLANVRAMEQYRQGFFLQIIAGNNSASAPSGGSIGINSGTVSYGSVGGFFGLLQTQMRLMNQKSNVRSLKDSLDRMEANHDANRLSSYQVDQTRQSWYQSQLTLLSLQNSYNNSVDQFKITLGLPPELPVKIDDPLLESFELIGRSLQDLQTRTEDTLVDVRSKALKDQQLTQRLQELLDGTREQIEVVKGDIQSLEAIAPERRADLKSWADRKERWGNDFNTAIFDTNVFDKRLKNVQTDSQRLFEEMGKMQTTLEQIVQRKDEADNQTLEDDLYHFNGLLLELILVQARTRLDMIVLKPIDMDSECAIEVARQNRLDWMNARAALVDQWRKIEIAKNALKGNLSLTFDGSLNYVDSLNGGNRTTGEMSLGLQFDAPLTRLSERNAYRRALISYYQAHRNFMAFEDNLRLNIREIIREINLCQMSFELQRASVFVSMSQYDQRRLQLDRPPKPGETSSFGDSFARDLIDALDNLLSSQNQIMSDWLRYEVMRMTLNFALGTMKVDANGMWIDDGSLQNICPAGETVTSPSSDGSSNEPNSPTAALPTGIPLESANSGANASEKSDGKGTADEGAIPGSAIPESVLESEAKKADETAEKAATGETFILNDPSLNLNLSPTPETTPHSGAVSTPDVNKDTSPIPAPETVPTPVPTPNAAPNLDTQRSPFSNIPGLDESTPGAECKNGLPQTGTKGSELNQKTTEPKAAPIEKPLEIEVPATPKLTPPALPLLPTSQRTLSIPPLDSARSHLLRENVQQISFEVEEQAQPARLQQPVHALEQD